MSNKRDVPRIVEGRNGGHFVRFRDHILSCQDYGREVTNHRSAEGGIYSVEVFREVWRCMFCPLEIWVETDAQIASASKDASAVRQEEAARAIASHGRKVACRKGVPI